jgi:hypothetical protein
MDVNTRSMIYQTIEHAHITASLSVSVFALSKTRINDATQEGIQNILKAAIECAHLARNALRLEVDSAFCASASQTMQQAAFMVLRECLDKALDADPAIVADVEEGYQAALQISKTLATIIQLGGPDPMSTEGELRNTYQALASIYIVFPPLDASP